MNEAKVPGSSLEKEEWREYRFSNDSGGTVVHRIDAPETLYMRPGGTTHRVLDSAGLVHVVPAPGLRGCVLTYKPKDKADPVQF
jgi:hypothetical protein